MGTLSPYPWQGHCPCTHYAALARSLGKASLSRREAKKGFGDDVPEQVLGRQP